MILSDSVRNDWSLEDVRELFARPLLDLVFQAATVHRQFHKPNDVQVCQLISIKTGACPEDCGYCSQSSRYETDIQRTPLMQVPDVVERARRAKENGATRVCLGAAWREVKDNDQFDRVLNMVRDISGMGMEVCCTLGMLTGDQARKLEEAGLYAYNHNLDTSREHYSKVITTRTYDDRLRTIENIRQTKITVCCGGILGLGESHEDRISLLHTLSNLKPHPESVPVNVLSKVPGTPMADEKQVPIWETIRVVAVARILMPEAEVRLSAGRAAMSVSDQALAFMAGANSIFSSENQRMLTSAVPTQDYQMDREMFEALGLQAKPASNSCEADCHHH